MRVEFSYTYQGTRCSPLEGFCLPAVAFLLQQRPHLALMSSLGVLVVFLLPLLGAGDTSDGTTAVMHPCPEVDSAFMQALQTRSAPRIEVLTGWCAPCVLRW